jgi:hypothetical protein
VLSGLEELAAVFWLEHLVVVYHLPPPRLFFPLLLFPRTLSICMGVPVNAAKATATLTSCPPPSPVLPSILTSFCSFDMSRVLLAAI